MMSRRVIAIVLCAVTSRALLASSSRESTGTIVVTVSSSDGRPVTGLTPDDFVVQVDKSTESLTSFSAASPALALLVLFDQSSSVTDFRGRLSKDVAETMAAALRDGDHLRIGQVAGAITIGAPIKISKRDIETAIKNLPKPPNFAASPLWDAVNEGARALTDDAGRRLVLLITDGRSTASRLSSEQAATTAALASVAVSTIDQGRQQALLQDNTRVITVRSAPLLQWISRMTGGQYYADEPQVFRPQALPMAAIARAIQDQRTTYQLTVPVPDDRQFHPVTVRVVQPGVTVHAPGVIHSTPGTTVR